MGRLCLIQIKICASENTTEKEDNSHTGVKCLKQVFGHEIMF